MLVEKGIISEDEFIAKFKKFDGEMKEKGGGDYFCCNSIVLGWSTDYRIQLAGVAH